MGWPHQLQWTATCLVLVLCWTSSSSSCPRKCQCLWRGSKITVDCSERHLGSIPNSGVESNTQGEAYTYNWNAYFSPIYLLKGDWVTYQKWLNSISLVIVPIDSMIVLNMSGNVIPLLMGQQFSTLGLINLQRISMAKCGLIQIDGHAFGGLNNLVELDLSQNQLKQVRRVSQRIFQQAFF